MIDSLVSGTINKQAQLAIAEHPLEWAAGAIDYKRAESYDTPYKGPFDPDLLPFWRQPLSDSVDDNIREVVVNKCSRAGGSENFLLTRLRYGIAIRPEATMYITADVEGAERFMEDRIKRGMLLAAQLEEAYKSARITEHAIRFQAMDLRIMWSRNKGAFKQDGYELILADEVSTWPAFAADMLRKRADMYPFHHILFISSPDPARKGDPNQDPIVVLYADTDKRKWMMPDPGGKGTFFYRFGDGKGDGIIIPKDAKRGDEWDLDAVRAKTYYKTPSGAHVLNNEREDLMRAGRWVATAKGHRDDVTGYHVAAPMIPTRAGDFGELAARFLAAKYHLTDTGSKQQKEHSPLRVYFAEYWAEAHREEQMTITENALVDREQDYEAGTVFVDKEGAAYGVALTVDVQKFHLWYVARAWSVSGENVSSSLVEWGTLPSFAALHDKTSEINPSVMGIDIGYALRASEVGDFCAEHSDQANIRDARIFALRGNDQQTKNIIDQQVRDALEGRAANGQRLFVELMWQTDVFRTWLIEMMAGLGKVPWYVCKGLQDTREGQEYIRQVTSTRKVDGIWIPPKHGQDHMFDCEVMQLVLARSDGLI